MLRGERATEEGDKGLSKQIGIEVHPRKRRMEEGLSGGAKTRKHEIKDKMKRYDKRMMEQRGGAK